MGVLIQKSMIFRKLFQGQLADLVRFDLACRIETVISDAFQVEFKLRKRNL